MYLQIQTHHFIIFFIWKLQKRLEENRSLSPNIFPYSVWFHLKSITGFCQSSRIFVNVNNNKLSFFFRTGGVWSLRNLSISVPRAVLSGEGQSATLRCSYDLEDAALYSIRWYKTETEFYRFVPREMPPTMVFPLPGASVDVSIYNFSFVVFISF